MHVCVAHTRVGLSPTKAQACEATAGKVSRVPRAESAPLRVCSREPLARGVRTRFSQDPGAPAETRERP